MLYIGRSLLTPRGSIEPSLIDPSLPVDNKRPDYAGTSMDYWPSYHAITPGARAAYLEWLEEGRQDPDAYIGYVFLYMYGLERRVIVDMREKQEATAHDLRAIRDEMLALRDVYGDQGSFGSYSIRLLDLLEFLISADDKTPATPPQLTRYGWEVPFAVRTELGSYAASGQPLPAEWALAWVWFSDTFRPRTPAQRCINEFRALFTSEYNARYGDGILLKPTKKKLALQYFSASSGIGQVNIGLDTVFEVSTTALNKLVPIAETAQEELEGYSRYLGKNPHDADTLNALAMLPARLLAASDSATLHRFRTWAESTVTGQPVVIPGSDLLEAWGTDRVALTKAEAIPVIQLLSKLRIGVEPDVRFSGPGIAADAPAVLFPLSQTAPATASPGYSTATTLSHLAAAVSAADGTVDEHEIAAFLPAVQEQLDLTDDERERLNAHVTWLAAGPTKLTGLTKRIAELNRPQRTQLGTLLIDVAAADGHVSAEEMRTLEKIYKLLSLDPTTLPSDVFARQTSGEPVVVRTAQAQQPGVPIPARNTSSPTDFTLDDRRIAEMVQESAQVAELLGGIFADDEPVRRHGRRSAAASSPIPNDSISPATDGGAVAVAVRRVSGLNESHSAIVRALDGRNTIDRDEFETLARAYKLMPMGAIDTINEAAMDAADEPLLEGEDPITINEDAMKELVQ
jgi:uncharacterized tellurite resistance protein B-like protein